LSEHIGDIALTLGFAVEQDAAQNMLSGIISATQNFQDPRTSSLAFEIASLLMKQGARRASSQAPSRAPAMSNPAPQMNGVAPRPAAPTQPAPVRQPQAVQQPPRPAPAPVSMPDNYDQVEQPEDKNEKPPLDWLTPKVYKGSSEV